MCKFFHIVGWLCLIFVAEILAKGRFITYNNVERQKFLDLQHRHTNEIDSHLHNDVSPSATGQEAEQNPKKAGPSPKYDPTWESLDARPLPAWYDQSKIGIFIHWGVYSVPGFGSEWFWKSWTDGRERYVDFMNKNFKPGFSYQEFGSQFTAEFYNATHWANLFKRAGAKYVVLTSKHHEGYTLWPSRFAFSWNAQVVGPHKDILGQLAGAIRNETDLKFGLYHSLYEWYNPLWINDNKNNLTTDEFVQYKTLPEMFEIVNTYKPEIVWSDGEWEAPDTYWQSKEFLAWLYNESPVKDTVVTNDRWGHETLCTHGGYYTCADRYNPGVLQPHKWENCMTLDKESWGYRRDADIVDYLTPEELMTTIIETVSCGGNVLVNVGPTREGTIPPIQEERLEQMGEWLAINGEAIYNAIPYDVQNDTLTPGIWYTQNESKTQVYAMLTSWPGATVRLGSIASSANLRVSMLGTQGQLQWFEGSPGIIVTTPRQDANTSKWAWTLVITR